MNYMKNLYAGATEGNIAVWHKRTKGTKWFSVRDIDGAAEYMIAAANDDDVYFGWCVQDESAPGRGGRGTSATASIVPGIMFDADLRSNVEGVHAKNDHLPGTVDEVRALVEEMGLPAPTAIRLSGNGSYFDWLFNEPYAVSTDDDREHISSLSRRFHKVLISAGKARGWSFDNTSDLARVTRMPGTKNHKTTPPRDVTLLDNFVGQRYAIGEIEAAIVSLERRFSADTKLPNTMSVRPLRSRATRKPVANDNEPAVEAIIEGCAWMAELLDGAAHMAEPDWYALAGIVGRCANGAATFHEISAEDARYDSTETQEKLDHALKSAGPRTCANISETFDGCRNCPFRNKIKSPIQLGHLSKVRTRLMRGYVFDVATHSYIDVKSGRYLDMQQFNSKFRHETGGKTPHSLLIEHNYTRKVDRSRYIPGDDGRFVSVSGEEVFNTWRHGGVAQQPGGDASIILEHLDYLFPQADERAHLLNCLASLVQRPSDKIKHVLLLIGRQGTGKSFFSALLERMVGRRNIKTANSDALAAEWTENVLDCQVLFLEELMTQGRKEVYNRMKTWVADDTALANQKGMKIREASTPRIIIGTSNHAIPVSLESGDRRFFVLRSDVERRDDAYYKRLFDEGLQQAGGFIDYLSKVDISAFNPSAPPPMTQAKAAIIDDARPRVEQVLRDLLEREHPYLSKDVVAVSNLRSLIQICDNRIVVSHSQLAEALREVGGVYLGQVRLGGNLRERLWAVRNVDKWKGSGHAELRTYLTS